MTKCPVGYLIEGRTSIYAHRTWSHPSFSLVTSHTPCSSAQVNFPLLSGAMLAAGHIELSGVIWNNHDPVIGL